MDGEHDNSDGNSCLDENVTAFLKDGCGCSGGENGNHCSELFSKEIILTNLYNHAWS